MFQSIPYRFRVLAFLCSLTALTYLDRICISLVGVRVKADLGLSNTQFGWVLGAFSLAYALFEIPAGILGDKIGARAVLIRIVIWWSVCTALTGMVSGLFSLIIIRFLFGVGEAGTYPNSMIVISRWFPKNETGRALAWLGIGSQLGSAIAPWIIVTLAGYYGWRIPFFVNGAIGIVWVLACYFGFRNSPAEVKKISPSEREKIESGSYYTSSQHSIPWRVVLNNRNLLSLLLMYFCCQWAQYFFVAWMPLYLQEGRHFSESEMKNIAFVIFLVGICGNLVGGAAGDYLVRKKGLKIGRRAVGITGLASCGTLIFISSVVPNQFLSALCLIGANFSFTFAVMSSYAVCADIGRNNCGTVTGSMNFFGQTGAFFLAIFFGRIADATHSLKYPMFLLAFVISMGAVFWTLIDPTKKIRELKLEK
ncbi:MAG: MFS transporter [Bacteroidetes bacterium]|nr:MAG: MFS transporter [Bacteroidota bacterium]